MKEDGILQNDVQPHNNFLKIILFIDGSRFINLGLFNRQNTRYWSQENQHLFNQGNFQEQFDFNVLLGVIGTRIIGPVIFDGPLIGARYLQFIQNEIGGYLENLPLAIERVVFYQQDGAPPTTQELSKSTCARDSEKIGLQRMFQ
ncbi:hypothetical protein HHI36_021753 [Cryptolaemus montrouzieri]|uniref:Uncharacterized protein n=1 Tax=Cryptolaemus montrouzieri TaxID=559131 RepID=A0ABD2MY50_9CUCU